MNIFKNNQILFAFSLIISFIIYLNITSLHSWSVGLSLFLTYLFINTFLLRDIINDFGGFFSSIISLYIVIYIIRFLGAIFNIFNLFYEIHTLMILLAISLITYLISYVNKNNISESTIQIKKQLFEVYNKRIKQIKLKINLYTVSYSIIIILIPIGIILLLNVRGDIGNLWDIIPMQYVYIYIIITFFVSIFIFSNNKIYDTLIFIILHSFFVHSTLLFVIETTYGSDSWRHMAKIQMLLENFPLYPPTFRGDTISFFGFKLPEMIFSIKTTESMFISLSSTITRILQCNLVMFYKLINPILSSLYIPLFLFFIGKYINPDDKKFGLLFSFMPIMFYENIIYASFTVPVGMGLVDLVFILFLWVKYIYDKNFTYKYPLFFTLANYFTYPTIAIYSLLIMCTVIVTNKLLRINKNIVKHILFICYILIVIFIIPVFDTIPAPANLVSVFKNYNINDIELIITSFLNYFVDNYFLKIEFVFLSTFTLIGLFIQKENIFKQKIWTILFILFIMTQFNSVIVWNFMDGPHQLGRRIASVTYIFMSPFIISGVLTLINYNRILLITKNRHIVINMNLLTAIMCGFLTINSLLAYTSGPVDVENAQIQDVEAVKRIIDNANTNYCILADWSIRYPLHNTMANHSVYYKPNTRIGRILSTEIEKEYFHIMRSDPSIENFNKILKQTNTTLGYFLVTNTQMSEININEAKYNFQYTTVGKWYLFKYQYNKENIFEYDDDFSTDKYLMDASYIKNIQHFQIKTPFIGSVDKNVTSKIIYTFNTTMSARAKIFGLGLSYKEGNPLIVSISLDNGSSWETIYQLDNTGSQYVPFFISYAHNATSFKLQFEFIADSHIQSGYPDTRLMAFSIKCYRESNPW